MARFPNIVGAVDCTHIALIVLQEELWVYHKWHHIYSQNVQVTCNHQGIFTDFAAKILGSIWPQLPVGCLGWRAKVGSWVSILNRWGAPGRGPMS